MEFAFNEEQRMIQDSAARFLAQASDSQAVRAAMARPEGHDRQVWQQIAQELCWPALIVPERFGGLGQGFVDLAILLEQSGRHLLCGPLLATTCLATPALLLAENPAAQERWLGEIAAGATATLAFASQPGLESESVQALAVPGEDGYRLSGTYLQVLDGGDAQLLIVAARSPGSEGQAGISLFAVPAESAGISHRTLPTLDQTRRLANLEFLDVAVSEAQLLCSAGQGWPLLRDTLLIAGIGLAAEQTGGAQHALDLTLAYTAQRQQFGRPIASFQAVKHRCADLMLELECARSASWYAACVAQERLDPQGDPAVAEELLEACATAQIHASEAFFHCAAESIQLHGGVGFTWEYDPHLYFKRARASEQLLGSPALHRERLASRILGDSL
ncbi:Acyl-CoA dehydrogenase [Pseudomonas fluorescens]|nr:Acyl-CoA dehydrogenase [Pseudomonas fluorescens]